MTCPQCGTRLASRDRLPGHYRRAHPGLVAGRSGRARGKVLDVTPSRPQIVRSGREFAPARHIQGETRIVAASPRTSGLDALGRPLENPPAWFEQAVRPATRRAMWIETPPDERERLCAQRSAFTVRAPDDVTLLSQFHMLKALAVRLDAGIGTERDRALFEVGLRQYDVTFERVRTRGNVP